MTAKLGITTRAGAGLPPAFAWGLTALALWGCLGSAVSARAEEPPASRWGWGVRDSLAAPPAAAPDSSGPAAEALSAPALRSLAGGRDSTRASFDYLWVVRTAILTPADVDSAVARAKARGVRGLLVQVVGRGDAYYTSDLLPRPEALRDPSFDPLARIVERGHAAGLEVHAWMNCMLVWSAEGLPRDPRHVVRAHPEWVARLRDGRRLSQLSPRQRERLGLEGVFLAPAHPGVRTWLARVASELVSRYPVDGLQLDYIRQPIVAIGWDPTTRARFALQAGVDPARFDRLADSGRRGIDSMWAAFQGAQVQAAVEEIRDSVRAARPSLPISAAVIADTLTAERNNAQRWREWLRRGLLDRAFVMCYAQPVQTVMDQLLGYLGDFGADGRVVPGIAVYNTPPSTAAAKILGARALGYPVLAVYSYDALAEQPGYWALLLDFLAGR